MPRHHLVHPPSTLPHHKNLSALQRFSSGLATRFRTLSIPDAGFRFKDTPVMNFSNTRIETIHTWRFRSAMSPSGPSPINHLPSSSSQNHSPPDYFLASSVATVVCAGFSPSTGSMPVQPILTCALICILKRRLGAVPKILKGMKRYSRGCQDHSDA